MNEPTTHPEPHLGDTWRHTPSGDTYVIGERRTTPWGWNVVATSQAGEASLLSSEDFASGHYELVSRAIPQKGDVYLYAEKYRTLNRRRAIDGDSGWYVEGTNGFIPDGQFGLGVAILVSRPAPATENQKPPVARTASAIFSGIVEWAYGMASAVPATIALRSDEYDIVLSYCAAAWGGVDKIPRDLCGRLFLSVCDGEVALTRGDDAVQPPLGCRAKYGGDHAPAGGCCPDVGTVTATRTCCLSMRGGMGADKCETRKTPIARMDGGGTPVFICDDHWLAREAHIAAQMPFTPTPTTPAPAQRPSRYPVGVDWDFDIPDADGR